MTSRVELEATGAGNPLPVFAELSTAAAALGLRVWVEDPVALANGSGRFTIDVPNAKSAEEAIAAVSALLNQVPGGYRAFNIATEGLAPGTIR